MHRLAFQRSWYEDTNQDGEISDYEVKVSVGVGLNACEDVLSADGNGVPVSDLIFFLVVVLQCSCAKIVHCVIDRNNSGKKRIPFRCNPPCSNWGPPGSLITCTYIYI